MSFTSGKDVLDFGRKHEVKFLDVKFMDFPGILQHFTVPFSHVDEETFVNGLGFDGSSIRGWQSINESDMLVILDPTTAKIDPFCEIPTITMMCNVKDPITGNP